MRRTLTLLVCLLILTCACLAEDPALTFHNDSQRTGRSTFIGPIPPRLCWTFRAQASIEASPVIARDGTIYLASTDGFLYAITPTGRWKWTFAANESIVGTPAVAPDGSIQFGDLSGFYYAVNPDGTLKWSVSLASGHREYRAIAAPVIAPDGRSYIGAWNDHFFAFDPAGNLIWQVELQGEGQITAAPSLDSAGNVYLATHDPANKSRIAVLKFDPASPEPRWKFSDDMGIDRNRIIASPVIDDARGQLYVGAARDTDGILYAVSLATGKVVFRAVLPMGTISTPAIGWDGTLYVGCLNGKLFALDPATGKERWRFSADAPYILGSAAVDGAGTIYIGDSDGIVYAVNSAGKEIWRFPTENNISSAPVVSGDGMLYLSSCDSRLYALGHWKIPGRRQ